MRWHSGWLRLHDGPGARIEVMMHWHLTGAVAQCRNVEKAGVVAQYDCDTSAIASCQCTDGIAEYTSVRLCDIEGCFALPYFESKA